MAILERVEGARKVRGGRHGRLPEDSETSLTTPNAESVRWQLNIKGIKAPLEMSPIESSLPESSSERSNWHCHRFEVKRGHACGLFFNGCSLGLRAEVNQEGLWSTCP
jgi:hypothetical protein